jgi:hypothetical protein
MGYSAETNDINFSSGTTAFYGFLGFLHTNSPITAMSINKNAIF